MVPPRLTHCFRRLPACGRILFAVALITLAACDAPKPRPTTAKAGAHARPGAARVVDATSLLRPEHVGRPIDRPPWIAHLVAADLDRDGKMDILATEAQENTILWLRQTPLGTFEEKVVGTDLRAPVHVEAADLDGDSDLDLIVSSMGYVFPNNDKIGTVYLLENDGRQNFTPHIVLENASRVVDARAADFNGDGKIDLVLGQFGYDQGEISWLERTGPWEFRYHLLLDLSGAINVCVADFDGNRTPDIAALISQQWEEVYTFQNDGSGNFTTKRIWGSTNEDYGSSGLIVCDLNRDGRPDLLFSNGDGFGPAATPGPRPWHGLQWFENVGGAQFRYRRIGDLAGAYSPVAVDFDGDGAMDVISSAAYADWNNRNRNVISLMWFRNDGQQNFEPRILARTPKDLITMTAADLDGSGKPSLITGGFYIYPPYDALSRITVWRR